MCHMCQQHVTKDRLYIPACAKLYQKGCCEIYVKGKHGLTESTNLVMPSINKETIVPERSSFSWKVLSLFTIAFVAIVAGIIQLESFIKKIVKKENNIIPALQKYENRQFNPALSTVSPK